LDAVIDTGSNGQLALPAETARDLGLTLDRFRRVTPAIGVSRVVASGNVHLNWDGEPKNVRAIEAGTEPLIGMALLWGNRIMIDAIEDGAVSIAAIPATT
jgi:predicted aspartyl protease